MEHHVRLYVVTGSSGVGKTTIVSFLKEQSLENIDIHDFDELLPNLKEQLLANEQLASKAPHDAVVDAWRKETTTYWIDLAAKNAQTNTSTLVVGLVHPLEVAQTQPTILVSFCLLDASVEQIEQRLMGKRFSTEEKREGLFKATGKTPQDFILENKSLMEQLRQENQSVYGTRIDTTYDTPQQTGKKIISWIDEIVVSTRA